MLFADSKYDFCLFGKKGNVVIETRKAIAQLAISRRRRRPQSIKYHCYNLHPCHTVSTIAHTQFRIIDKMSLNRPTM